METDNLYGALNRWCGFDVRSLVSIPLWDHMSHSVAKLGSSIRWEVWGQVNSISNHPTRNQLWGLMEDWDGR